MHRGLALLLLLGLAPAAAADVVAPRSGKKLEGALVSETEQDVVINIYWSRNPGVTNPAHVKRFARSDVKKVTVAPHPQVEVFRRLADAKDAEARYQVGLYAKEHKLKYHARLCFGLALAKDEEHAAARKALGGPSKWKSLRRGHATFDTRIEPLLRAYAGEKDLAARQAIAKDLKKIEFGAKPHELERFRRSALQPTGYQEDRPLAWNAAEHPGAVYTLFVPKGYDPARPWPLVIGLHGGGPDGARGDEVVGSGPSAMNFYRRQAAARGFLVACPNALKASWGRPENEQLVRDVIAEVTALYHIDRDRVYLTGHSMGGFGTWALGPRLAEDLAAVSPMAGGGRGGIQRLVDTRTPIFIFHSADDFVAVGPDRAAAKALKKTDLDFVYTEFPNAGHGFPDSVQAELFDFFTPRRRYRKGAKDLAPQSSFRGPVSKLEAQYLGDPRDTWKGVTPELSDWLAWLRLGGGRALQAVAHIQAQRPEGAAAGVAKVLGQAALPFDARGYAARCLGALEAKDMAGAIAKALVGAPSKQQSFVAIECAHALGRLGTADDLRAVERALEAWTKFYESKVSGAGQLHFSDWERSLNTLAPLAAGWAALATPESDVRALTKTVVARVLAHNHAVRTSKRVPQDPSRARTKLAEAIAAGFVKAGADEEAWAALRQAVSSDARATAVVERATK